MVPRGKLIRRTLKVYSMKVDFSCVGGIEYCVKLSLSICIQIQKVKKLDFIDHV